jgi:hypothetical protein
MRRHAPAVAHRHRANRNLRRSCAAMVLIGSGCNVQKSCKGNMQITMVHPLRRTTRSEQRVWKVRSIGDADFAQGRGRHGPPTMRLQFRHFIKLHHAIISQDADSPTPIRNSPMPSPTPSSFSSSSNQKQTSTRPVERSGFRTVGMSSDPSQSRTLDEASLQERKRRIAERAYELAASRNFIGGDPVSDWLQAERAIDAASPE